MTLVMKFGGSSLADAACLRQVASLVRAALPRAPLVVLSAMGKTTDALFRAARCAAEGRVEAAFEELRGVERLHRAEADRLFDGALPAPTHSAFERCFGELERVLQGVALLRELSPRSLDALAARGELLSTALFAGLLVAQGVDATWFDAREVVRTDAGFGCAQPRTPVLRTLAGERLAPLLGAGRTVVTQGYIGASDDGATTTLGRGGSDFSAALLGAALGAEEVQIWTDVEGVYTCDPRRVPQAQPIAELSFAEAAELAAFGAKVLHPATIQPAVEARIPVTVRHTQRPAGRFTTIREQSRGARAVVALASRGPVNVVTVTSTRMLDASGFLARLFEVFGRLNVSVDLVATAEVSVSLTVEQDAPLAALRAELERFARVEVATDRALIALVGERLRQTPGVPARALRALEDLHVEMLAMGANEVNLSLVVARSVEDEAVRRLHAALFE